MRHVGVIYIIILFMWFSYFIFTDFRGPLVSLTGTQYLGTLYVGVGILYYKPRGIGTEYIVGTCQGRRRVYYDVDNII